MSAKDNNQWPATATIRMDLCPRCGRSHGRIEFRRFELGDSQFTHWAYCEATGEPLLLNMALPRIKPSKFHVRFVGTGKKAQCAPNPNYPDGIDLPSPHPDQPKCKVTLPYPATEIGAWKVECSECGVRSACTTAGRPDDPRSIELPCKKP